MADSLNKRKTSLCCSGVSQPNTIVSNRFFSPQNTFKIWTSLLLVLSIKDYNFKPFTRSSRSKVDCSFRRYNIEWIKIRKVNSVIHRIGIYKWIALSTFGPQTFSKTRERSTWFKLGTYHLHWKKWKFQLQNQMFYHFATFTLNKYTKFR